MVLNDQYNCLVKYWKLFVAGKLKSKWVVVLIIALFLAVVIPILMDRIELTAAPIVPTLIASVWSKVRDADDKLRTAEEVLRGSLEKANSDLAQDPERWLMESQASRFLASQVAMGVAETEEVVITVVVTTAVEATITVAEATTMGVEATVELQYVHFLGR